MIQYATMTAEGLVILFDATNKCRVEVQTQYLHGKNRNARWSPCGNLLFVGTIVESLPNAPFMVEYSKLANYSINQTALSS
jgi:hypothetical protein